MHRAVSLVGVSLLLACGSIDTGTVVHARAAELLRCRRGATEITQLGAYRYRGEGCGRAVVLACTAGALEPVCMTEEELRGDVAVASDEEASEEPSPREPEDSSAGGGDPEVEAQIRAGLDARSEDILGCVGRERVGVRVAYDADGTVRFALQGTLADTPEERCVSQLLAGVRVQPTGRAGVVVHLVR